ncbi:MAG: hypothetical protein HPY69_09490 [Armatimonadetes bacterium]|nr:hypothetical protein [Armatimonadota bacterium]
MRQDSYAQVNQSYEFLRQRAASGEEFSLTELMDATGWTRTNAKTNISKRMSEFVVRRGRGRWVALPVIERVRRDDYARLFSQSNRLFGDYELWLYPDLIIYDFLMPLTREDRLRESLDSLFYRDRLEQRLRELGAEVVAREFERHQGEQDGDLFARVAAAAGDAFVGYSISHVSGRFRMRDLMTTSEAACIPLNEQGYLADETTAVVRFIMRVSATEQRVADGGDALTFDFGVNDATRALADAERNRIRWLFLNVFAKAVVMTVNYEEEIWLLEQGAEMRLWVWKRRE